LTNAMNRGIDDLIRDELIFVYGTLHPDRAPVEIVHVARRLELVGEGTIAALKYQFRHYSAIVLDAAGEVAGHVFRVPEAALWADLDAYERYHPMSHDTSLFLRKRTTVTMTDGSTLEAWVYEYARPLPR
jgi:gamma-glutamylcyclotransferase (GGCT)/AIG2-like uncharacterized protein YtfP